MKFAALAIFLCCDFCLLLTRFEHASDTGSLCYNHLYCYYYYYYHHHHLNHF